MSMRLLAVFTIIPVLSYITVSNGTSVETPLVPKVQFDASVMPAIIGIDGLPPIFAQFAPSDNRTALSFAHMMRVSWSSIFSELLPSIVTSLERDAIGAISKPTTWNGHEAAGGSVTV